MATPELTFSSKPPEQLSRQGNSPRLRTVVVDDSDTFLEVTCELLELEDVIDLLAAASDGVAALNTVARLKPALVLMDVAMPGLDGLAATKLLTEMAPAPIVVLMSSEDTQQMRADCRRAGAFAFVRKVNFRDDFGAVLELILQTTNNQAARESA